MRLRHIEVIQAIAQSASLAQAAELLDLPVAAVAESLKQAEHQLGFLLFSQVRAKLLPTPEALALQGSIDDLYLDLERVRRLANGLRQHQDPALRVVCHSTLAQQLLPHSIAALRRRFRETPCSLHSEPNAGIVRSLLLRESHVGFTLHDPSHPALETHVLHQGKLHVLAPHGWLPARHKHLGLQELAGQAMIGLEDEDPLSRLLEHRLQAISPPPRVRTRVQTYQMMRSMVEAGEGLAIVDPFTASGAKAAGLDVCPVAPAIQVSLYALTLRDAHPPPALGALLEIIREKAQTLTNGSGE